MKKINICIYGYGQELVQGTWSDKELETLLNELNDDNDLSGVIWNLQEILPDSYDWYDRDDLCHYYGGLADSCKIIISYDDKEDTYDTLFDLDAGGAIIEFEEVYNYTGKENVITIISAEKGIMFDADIILKDNEEFDLSKLRIESKGIIFNNYENELITSIYYKDKQIDDEGCDTNGKGFYAYLDKKKNQCIEKEEEIKKS